MPPSRDSEHPERTFEQLLSSVNAVDVRPPPIVGASRSPRFFGYIAPRTGLTSAAQEAALNARSPWFHGIVLDDAVDRPGWARLAVIARDGDVVFVARPEVLGNGTARIWERIVELEKKGARVVILEVEPPASSMRPIGTVMVVGDVHGDLGWIKSLLERAHQLGVDTVLSVGDFGIGPFRGDTPGTRFGPKTERIAAKNGVTVYVVPGNHENYDTISALTPRPDGWLEMSGHVRVAPRGHRWSWTGVQFGALGGAFSVDWRHRQTGRDWWPAVEEVRPEDIERLGSGDLDVLVSHDVPSGIPIGPGGLFSPHPIPEADLARAQVSRDLLLDAVRRTRPELLLCGHHHQRLSTTLPPEVAARDVRPTVAARNLGYEDAEARKHVRIEVLDREHTGNGWFLLSLNDLAITEQATAAARARDRGDR